MLHICSSCVSYMPACIFHIQLNTHILKLHVDMYDAHVKRTREIYVSIYVSMYVSYMGHTHRHV
jgi:hypothetical protein